MSLGLLPFAVDTTTSSPPRCKLSSIDHNPQSTFYQNHQERSNVDTTAPDYESTRARLEEMADKASRIPLPKSFDEYDGDDNQDDDDNFLICRGDSIDDEVEHAHNNNNVDAIPYESFLKLGASQMIGADADAPPLQSAHGSFLAASSDGDDSVIPMTSFMNLGASMLADAMGAFKSDDDDNSSEKNGEEQALKTDCSFIDINTKKETHGEQEEDDTASLTEAGQSQLLENSAQSTNSITVTTKLPNDIPSPITGRRDEGIIDTTVLSILTTITSEVKDTAAEEAPGIAISEHSGTESQGKKEHAIAAMDPATFDMPAKQESNTSAEMELVDSAPPPLPCEEAAATESSESLLGEHNDNEKSSENHIYENNGDQECKEDVKMLEQSTTKDEIVNDIDPTQQEAHETVEKCMEPYLANSLELTEQTEKTVNPTYPTEEESTAEVDVEGRAQQGLGEDSVVATTPQTSTRRRKKKKPDGYFPSSSRFVSRHFFSR